MTDTFTHYSFGYGSDEEFVAVAVPFIRDGLAAGEPVLATASPDNLDLLDRSLGPDAHNIDVADPGTFGRRPPQRVAAFHKYWRDHVTRPDTRVRILAEPAWADWSNVETDSWVRTEAGLNVVMADTRVSMACPYDRRLLASHVYSSAVRTHPRSADAHGLHSNPDFADPREFAAECDRAYMLPPAPTDAAMLLDGTTDPRAVRAFAALQAREHDLTGERAQLFVLAVYELATYVTREFTVDPETLVWPATDALQCEVRISADELPEPYAGFSPPSLRRRADDRLWLVRQLCESVEFRKSDTVVSARLSFSRTP